MNMNSFLAQDGIYTELRIIDHDLFLQTVKEVLSQLELRSFADDEIPVHISI